MPENNPPKTISKSETGHAKFIESIERWIAADQTLDPLKLNAPAGLKSADLAQMQTDAIARFEKVGDSLAKWRTDALARQTDADQIAPLASRAVALLEANGASAETVKDARSYVRKIQGAGSKKADDPATPDVDESEKGISKSQQSNAAKLGFFDQLIEFLEAQPEYANVTNAGFTVAELRAFKDATQTKHDASIGSATTLSVDRGARNGVFYENADSVLSRAKRYKALVRGAYGADSPEYALVNAIPFRKPNK